VPSVRSITDLWPLLLLLAILLLPFDIGVRRVAVGRTDIARAIEEARRRLGILPRPQPAHAGPGTPELAALFEAKSRVRDRARPPQPPVLGRRPDAEATEPEAAVPWAQDLQLRGRAGRETGTPAAFLGAPAPLNSNAPQTAPPDAPSEGEESLATRLRRAREQRQ
jgi:hypothetical protein